VADAIAMPLTPSVLLILGLPGEQPVQGVFFHGDDAPELAEDVNAAGRPGLRVGSGPAGSPVLPRLDIPSPGPLIGVCDGGSAISQQLRSAPTRRWPRLRRDWPGMPSTAAT
jgi:hypothetical protein